MYTFIVKNKYDVRFRIYYNPHTSELFFHTGAIIEVSDKKFDGIIDKFMTSVRYKKKITDLEGHEYFKKQCKHCPVLHICGGRQNNVSCDDDFTEYSTILKTCVYLLTGMKLEVIEGYILR